MTNTALPGSLFEVIDDQWLGCAKEMSHFSVTVVVDTKLELREGSGKGFKGIWTSWEREQDYGRCNIM